MSKTIQAAELTIMQVPEGRPLPLELFSYGEPSKEKLHSYIDFCVVLVALLKDKTVGALAMSPESKEKAEIRNIAIAPDFRRRGYARKLVEEAKQLAKRLGFSQLQICAANSAIRPLKIYQQSGFELTEIRWNHYANHHTELPVEEGILCKHQLVLCFNLDQSGEIAIPKTKPHA